ncbi:uncharacterized protein LOC134530774 isoform X1 [Bacillus rossius redtenbacheri]|uniref:uncharacterized protein LOC134530774 isoform X1 n=1 Tax=Bacillus rossius redtenbacheri TaxID=93214 RepID=UPI002FDD0A97
MDDPGASKLRKRHALLNASPPEPIGKKTKTRAEDDCVICKQSTTSKRNPLQNPNQDTWNKIAEKALEWKDLGTSFDDIHEKIQVNALPRKIHKVCRLEVVGHKLLRAQDTYYRKSMPEENVGEAAGTSAEHTKEQRIRSSRIVSKSVCVFCTETLEGKTVRNNVGGRTPVKVHRLETQDAWKTFSKAVEYVDDKQTKDRLQAIITFCDNEGGIRKAAALDIKYHKDCWKTYCRPVYHQNASGIKKEHKQQRLKWLEEKQTEAFNSLCEYIVEYLDIRKEVYTLRDLLSEYEQIQRDMMIRNEEIRNTCDDKYALRSLRQKLETRFGNNIGFQPRYRRNESSIVFFTKHGGAYVESALNSWGMNTSNLIQNVAKILHGKHRKVPGIPWPCQVEELKNDNTPNDIHNLIALLADPYAKLEEDRAVVEERLQSAVRFLSEGVMHLITRKRQPLQVSLSISVHNLTGSKELINVLKKLRIGISYDDVLDELSALALQQHNNGELNNTGSDILICPQQIASGQPGTVVMDNDDFKEDGLTGSETSHYTNVIMAQSKSFRCDAQTNSTTLIIPTPEARRALVCPVVTKNLQNDGIHSDPQPHQLKPAENTVTVHRLVAHSLHRVIQKEGTVPSYTGYHCHLSSDTDKWETYNVKSYSQPPGKEVVKDVLNWCQRVAKHKKMPLIQLVGDQAIYKYIEECLCEDEDRWSLVKGVLGGFHTELSYLNAVGKRYSGSGIEELAVAAGVVAVGSLSQALSGKHYNRAMRLHKLIAEALIHMLTQSYIENHPDILEGLEQVVDISTEKEFDEFVASHSFNEFVQLMFQNIFDSNSDMAKFWLSYIIDVEVLFQHYHCLRSGVNFDEYLNSCRRMLPLLASYGNINYLRFLSLYYWRMSNLTDNEKKHMASIYSFSLTGKSYSKLPPDQVIEMTMNKQSKNRRSGGWVGFSKNLSMIAINILSRPAVLYLREQLQEAIDMKKPIYSHPELGPSRMKKDFRVIHEVKLALEEWDANPWDLSRPTLRSLCTGQPAPEHVVKSLDTAHDEGNAMAEAILNRLSSETTSLHNPITKRKSQTFATKTASTAKSRQTLRTLVDHAATKQVVDMLTSGETATMTLLDIMQYRITTVCLSLFTADGMFHKPVKSKFMTLLDLHPVMAPPLYHAIVDLGMAWNKIPACKTWSLYAYNLYNFILSRHPEAVAFHIVNDIYNEETLIDSTKYHEQKRRMISYGFVPNIYPIADKQMPTGSAWRSFLSKPANKLRLQHFLLNEWQSYKHNTNWYYTKDLLCYDLISNECDPRFEAPLPCEADIRAFFQAAQLDDPHPIVLDFEDTDVWVIASYISHITEQDMYMYKRKSGSSAEFYICRSLFSKKDKACAALGLYTFTGCDTVEGFFGCGKVTAIKHILQSNNLTYLQTVLQLGVSKELSHEMFIQLELLTIRIIYNDSVSQRLCEARERKWRQLRHYDSARLPPDEDSFRQHCLRSHLQAYEYKNARLLKQLPPTNFGWERHKDGLRPVTHTIPALPFGTQLPQSNETLSEECDNELEDEKEQVSGILYDSSLETSDTDEEYSDSVEDQ